MSALPSHGPSLDLSFLVVGWRSRAALSECVGAMLRTLDEMAGEDGWSGEVVVVDNASDDGTAAMLRDDFASEPRVQAILNSDNLNFAGGNNQAFRASDGATIAVVNPDVVVTARAIRAAIDHLAQHPEAGVATCRLVAPDGTTQSTHRSFPSLGITIATQTRVGRAADHRLLGDHFRDHYRLAGLRQETYSAIDQAAGAFMVFRRGLIGEVGGYLFDETMPLYFNDVDLCRRIHDAGLEVHLLQDEVVEHQGGVSLGQVDRDVRRVERWRGLLAFYERHQPRWQLAVVTACAPRAAREPVTSRLAPGLGRDPALVSIVIPAYNYERFLPEAIDSALDQTYEPIEVVIIDDGSTDATPYVAARYADRVRYSRTPNRGLSSARNRGAALARGELIVFLDADNRLAPSFVEDTAAALHHDRRAAFAYTQLRHFGDREGDTDKPGWEPERLRAGNYIDAGALIHADLVRRFPFDESNRVGWEDWDFWLTLAEHGYRGTLVDKPLVEYRRHQEAMTGRIVAVRKLDLRAAVLRRHRRYVGRRRWWKAEERRFRQRAGLARRRVAQLVSGRTP